MPPAKTKKKQPTSRTAYKNTKKGKQAKRAPRVLLEFPKGFLWGAATSAHQVEGENTNNDWWVWEQRKETVWNGDRSGKATGHWERYEEDYDLLEQLNLNTYRLSIEWSRIEPEEGQWDVDAVKHYKKMLHSLRKRKIKTFVTLHHFTNPLWLAEMGGWEYARTPEFFERYARYIAQELGQYVDFWITLNEPVIYTSQSYIAAHWPPQHKSWLKARRVFWQLAAGHKRAYQALHEELDTEKTQAQVGVAKNIISVVSYGHSFRDYLHIRYLEGLWNHLFYRLTRKHHDYIGINYYLHQRVRQDINGKRRFVDAAKEEQRDASSLGWESFAPGLFNVLVDLAGYRLPIYITENGIADAEDERRGRFIITHLKELWHAIQAGADVRGYIHWSLLDNFEWEKGYEPRFGLCEVDYDTLKRTPRPSSKVYAAIAKQNGLARKEMKAIGYKHFKH